jgi:putative ABC transport system permease protein
MQRRPHVQSLWEDVRFGARLLARSPGFTLAALATLALGIGANSALISFADAIFFRPLTVPDASRIVHVYQTRDGSGFFPLSLTDYFYFREHARSFADLAAQYPTSPLHVVVKGQPIAITGSVVTASYFSVLALQPALGRFFLDAEDQVRDRDAVVVVSHEFWQQKLEGSPEVLGQTIAINGRSFVIVGVAPPGFSGGVLQGMSTSSVWIPSAMFHVGYRYCDAFARDCTVVQMLGRLARQTTLDNARTELNLLARQLEASYPATNRGLGLATLPARGAYPDEQTTNLRMVALLLAGVGVVLLVACANVGGLLLVRGVKRRRELAIRLTLGADPGRVVRQLLTEATLLSIAGAAVGLIIATWANDMLRSFYSTDYAGRPLQFELGIRGWIIAVTGGLAFLTALLCGLVPALLASRTDVLSALKDESGTGGPRRSLFRDGLVVVQVACSMMLLVGAGLLVRSMQDISRGPGIDASRVILLRLRPSLVAYDGEKARAFQHEVIRRLEQLPGVEAASAGESLPMFGGGSYLNVSTGVDGGANREEMRVTGSRIGDRYFEVLGLTVLEGREFSSRDSDGARPLAIVNEVLARQLWPGQPVAGRALRVDGRVHEIVGVVRAARYEAITDRPVPYVYLNYWQQGADGGWPADSRTIVRVKGPAAAMMPVIRHEIAAIDPGVPLSEDYPLETRVAFNFRRVRMAMTILVCFGGLTLVLTAIGLYGVVSFATSLRTREIAIRLALGARPDQVRELVLGQGLKLVALGAGLGMIGAIAGSRLLSTLLYGVQPHDPGTFLSAAALLVAVAVVASGLPARRAMRVDPALTLRRE